MSNGDEPTVNVYHAYCPPGVKRVLAIGGSAFIGEVDDSTVKRKLLEIILPYERINMAFKGFTDPGIFLERATDDTIAEYIFKSGKPPPSVKQGLAWCREVAEAPTNLLLDQDLHIKLSDFQGRYFSEDGKVLLDGWSTEPYRFSCPRNDPFDANVKTDLSALGCTIYFIMIGHAVFPDIIDGEEGWYENVRGVLKGVFPQYGHACSTVTLKCCLINFGEVRRASTKAEPKRNI
ncbi:uncharacterized protein P884DRAFT_276911 [Thermothelomyces heterothallicus CBS 202.75]|uniref:uncharacterized protein n=1 Tax=Thermothelomyces heterothallicus CBS 202.75 TaxID=1149848 RepID=UPI003742E158